MFCFRPIVNVCFRFFKLILFENLFKLRQCRLTVYMLLTSSVLSTTSKHCFEQPAASFLVCSLIVIEYYSNYNYIYVKSSAIKYKSQKIQQYNIAIKYIFNLKKNSKINYLKISYVFKYVFSFFTKF